MISDQLRTYRLWCILFLMLQVRASTSFQYLTSGICSEKREEDETLWEGLPVSTAALCNAFQATWSWGVVLLSSVTCFTRSRCDWQSDECRQASRRALWQGKSPLTEGVKKWMKTSRVPVTEQSQELRSRKWHKGKDLRNYCLSIAVFTGYIVCSFSSCSLSR